MCSTPCGSSQIRRGYAVLPGPQGKSTPGLICNSRPGLLAIRGELCGPRSWVPPKFGVGPRNHSERAVKKSAWNYGSPWEARFPRTGTKSHGRSVFGSKYMAKTWFCVILDRLGGPKNEISEGAVIWPQNLFYPPGAPLGMSRKPKTSIPAALGRPQLQKIRQNSPKMHILWA